MNIVLKNTQNVNIFINRKSANIKSMQEHKNTSTDWINKVLARHYTKQEQFNKAYNISNCATYLQFKTWHDPNNTKKLSGANFCKHSMCPTCAWRLHLKMSKIISNALKMSKGYLYHLVLTIENTKQISRESIKELKANAIYFIRDVLQCNSYITNLEITYSAERAYHPHLHCILEFDEKKNIDYDYIHWLRGEWGKVLSKKWQMTSMFPITDAEKGALELTKYITNMKTIKTSAPITSIADATYNIRKLTTAGNLKKYISASKKELEHNRALEDEYLSNYNNNTEIYNYINGKYTLVNGA